MKVYKFLALGRKLSHKYGKQLLDVATKARLDALKTASKKVVHIATKTTGEFKENEIADKIANKKPVAKANSRNV